MRLLAAVAVAALAPVIAIAEETEVTFASVPAPNAESIVIEQPLGRLQIEGWDKPEVRIVARKHAKDAVTLDQLRVNFEMLDGHIRVRTGVRVGEAFHPLPTSMEAGGIDLTISAPRNVRVRAQTWAGTIEASGLRAGAELSSRGGEVHASDIAGRVRTTCLRGKQRLSAIHGDVEADGVTGDVELDAVDGEVLEAKVVEGQITARRIHSPVVRLFSSLGGVVFMGTTRPGGRYEITARDGNVRLVLQRTPFSIEARAPHGSIKNGFTLAHAAGSATTLTGEHMGGGPQLDLVAGNGDIILEPSDGN
jgi:DUF4097 and DUF4098 domain-containing protein YvlB